MACYVGNGWFAWLTAGRSEVAVGGGELFAQFG
jgi:hypothetical protein